MRKELIQTEKDILGVLYIIEELKRIYESEFAISSKNAFQTFEVETEEIQLKISVSTFARLFNFQKKPKISHTSMNKVIEWFTDRKYFVFAKYVDDHFNDIEKAKLLPEDEILKLIDRIKIKSTNKETGGGYNSINIKDVSSKSNTTIIIERKDSKAIVAIEKIESGGETSFKIKDNEKPVD